MLSLWCDTVIVLTLILVVALGVIRRFKELHHGYYGAALGILACFVGWPTWVMIVAIILLVDDDVQHVAEALGIVPRMADFTPIHKIGAIVVGWFTHTSKES